MNISSAPRVRNDIFEYVFARSVATKQSNPVRHCERSEAILRPQGLTETGQIATPFGLAMTFLGGGLVMTIGGIGVLFTRC